MEWDLLELGSIQERSFAEVLEDSNKAGLSKRTELLAKNECEGCEFWNICHGGCPLEGWLVTGSLMSRSRFCQAKIDFIKKYFEPTVYGTDGACTAKASCAGPFRSGSLPTSAMANELNSMAPANRT
jgi:radical SAM protein with 4Fe4S-binding SPASM domain